MAGPEASWEALDKELLSMLDIFSNLIKASRMPDEESDQVTMRDNRRDRAPGDLLEIWAEKLVHSGHMALVYVGQLKSQALFSDFETLMNRVRKIRVALGSEDQQVTSELLNIRQELADMLTQLERSYYSCPHKGRAPTLDMSAELKELAVIASELADKPDVLRPAPADKPAAVK